MFCYFAVSFDVSINHLATCFLSHWKNRERQTLIVLNFQKKKKKKKAEIWLKKNHGLLGRPTKLFLYSKAHLMQC